MKTYKQTNIDGLRKAGDAPRHTIVDYIHIIFAHSTIPVCCMFLCVTVLNPKLRLPLCEGLWPVDRMSNRRGGGDQMSQWMCVLGGLSWYMLWSDIRAYLGFCSPKVAWLPDLDGEVHGISPNLGKLHQLSAPQGMVVSSTWHPLKGLENYECRKWQDMLNLQSTGIRSVMYFKLFHWFGHPDLVQYPSSSSPTCEADSCTKWMSPNHRGWMTGVWKPTTGVGFIIWGGLNDRSAPFMIEWQALQAYW